MSRRSIKAMKKARASGAIRHTSPPGRHRRLELKERGWWWRLPSALMKKINFNDARDHAERQG